MPRRRSRERVYRTEFAPVGVDPVMEHYGVAAGLFVYVI
jgi:hypothetical protein